MRSWNLPFPNTLPCATLSRLAFLVFTLEGCLVSPEAFLATKPFELQGKIFSTHFSHHNHRPRSPVYHTLIVRIHRCQSQAINHHFVCVSSASSDRRDFVISGKREYRKSPIVTIGKHAAHRVLHNPDAEKSR
jgi:hypothetical protein